MKNNHSYPSNNNPNKFSSKNANDNPHKISTTSSDKLKKVSNNRLPSLPIDSMSKTLIDTIKSHQTTIVVGETGSGKSTRLPQFIFKDLLQISNNRSTSCIVCTQPRRVAAVTIAQRVSQEMNVELGNLVGYTVRFDDKSSIATRIKYVTDGVLLREAMNNSDLEKYSFIILDESHERSLQTDILMGLILGIQERRKSTAFPLRLIIMSATLDIDLFTSFFKDSGLVKIPGRHYPVETLYLKFPEEDYIDTAMLTCLQIHEEEDIPGDVLVFLPGQEEIENLTLLLNDNLIHIKRDQNKALNENSNTMAHDFIILQLYAAMSPEDQLKVFAKQTKGIRKFILSTNIAETSVTISGIKYVVDCGYVKTRWIQPNTGMEILKSIPISKSQANQRAGRAGREQEGTVYRLYTELVFETLDDQSIPEIQRVGMAQVILNLLSYGVKDIIDFPYLNPPSESILRKGLEQLYAFGAIDNKQTITTHGRNMSFLPIDPQYAHMLLKSNQFGCTSEILSVVSLLSSDNLFIHPSREEYKEAALRAHRSFFSKDGDISTLLNIYKAWNKGKRENNWAHMNYLNHKALCNAHNIRNQLQQLLHKLNYDTSISCHPETEPFLKCLTAGLFFNVARRNQGCIETPAVSDSLKSHNPNLNNKTISFSNSTNSRSSISTAPFQTLRTSEPLYLHPSSCLFYSLRRALSEDISRSSKTQKKLPEFIIYADLLITTKTYARNVTIIDQNWLSEVTNGLVKIKRSIESL